MLVLEHTLTKCQSEAGGKNQIIVLQAEDRSAYVVVTKGDLPAEPIFELGRSGGIELHTVGPGVTEIGKDAELLT